MYSSQARSAASWTGDWNASNGGAVAKDQAHKRYSVSTELVTVKQSIGYRLNQCISLQLHTVHTHSMLGTQPVNPSLTS